MTSPPPFPPPGSSGSPGSGPAGRFGRADPGDGALDTPLGRAAALMVGWLALLWLLVGIDAILDHRLLQSGGIHARQLGSLPDILTAPFLHANVEHIAANSTGLLGLGLLAALTGIRRFLAVTLVIAVVSGFGAWLLDPAGTVGVGASGLVFGYLGYLLLRGFVDRRPVDVLLTVAVALGWGYLLFGIVSGGPTVSWQAHLFGFLGGLLAAWLFRRRRPATNPTTPRRPGLSS
jgi:membrane associated rhomboid family serine protease